MVASASFIDKIYSEISGGVHFVTPTTFPRTNEGDLIRGVLHILQGLSSHLFYWDSAGQRFHARSGLYVSHLSQTSLHTVLNQFIYSATCLKLVEIVVNKVETSVKLTSPTLRAFASSVSVWLKRLRDVALKEEVNIRAASSGTAPTILGLASSLSSLFSGGEYLLQIVDEAIPKSYLELQSSPPAAEISVNILDYLYKKLDENCPVQGGEEDAYRMLLYIFVGSALPYVEGLDYWLFEGILDDPFDEMFFYANEAISINDADFWEKSYLLRQPHQKLDLTNVTNLLPLSNETKEIPGRESISMRGSGQNKKQNEVCPLFIKDIATAIVSAGKSLQLIRHCPTLVSTACTKRDMQEMGRSGRSVGINDSDKVRNGQRMMGLTLSEVFCVSLACLIGHGDHISKYLWQDERLNTSSCSLSKILVTKEKSEEKNAKDMAVAACSENVWCNFLVNNFFSKSEINSEYFCSDAEDITEVKEVNSGLCDREDFPFLNAFCPQNPAITVCRSSLLEKKGTRNALNLSKKFSLPPLNDESLRNDIFGTKDKPILAEGGTDYTFGFQFGDSEYLRSQNDTGILEGLFPFPTLLPSFQEKLSMSEFLPFQKNSTLPSRVIRWILTAEPKATPLPVVILQECLAVYIEKQVDYIGRNILSKLLNDWGLMDELGVLRAIFLLGSGDLLQHFVTVLFDKMDKGESCDDDFELNMILQESIANSSDGSLLSAPDSLVVSITQGHGPCGDEQHHAALFSSTSRKSHGLNFGINGLDSLNFAYKVSWPLELIANKEAIRKYNQVMSFLLKVKRAKFVLDKARRWMWKGRGNATISRKHHWLVEQKLLHFVDAFHQYVMDRVYHSAWGELCEGMATAASLDEVIHVHEAYLTSIQRQCFVVPDKLWALIASRINVILGLALDFHSVQQTLTSGAVSAIRARCEEEVDRIEKEFDNCIAFLLRVLSFKLNVGQFPHLADLVTRINYNYFYMSDTGNLITTPQL